ncbi:hypothetical protein [Winogradskya consettensis]|uniref:hypothetical protein n=1 Tax=Winogradskya consettensis TaxID=113560 RepID=UPI001BB40197|nr:hypothetical protein [Actinoplanes consettensis]
MTVWHEGVSGMESFSILCLIPSGKPWSTHIPGLALRSGQGGCQTMLNETVTCGFPGRLTSRETLR